MNESNDTLVPNLTDVGYAAASDWCEDITPCVGHQLRIAAIEKAAVENKASMESEISKW